MSKFDVTAFSNVLDSSTKILHQKRFLYIPFYRTPFATPTILPHNLHKLRHQCKDAKECFSEIPICIPSVRNQEISSELHQNIT